MDTRPRRRLGAPLKRDAVARLVLEMIADGTLKPGGAVPSGAALARVVGCSTLTARVALRMLLVDGTLVRGISRTGRLRVALAGDASGVDVETAKAALSKALAGRRRAAGLTQPELAAKLGLSLTTVGHAETGRVWQARGFWLRADQELGGTGDLLRLYDDFQVALAARSDPQDPEGPQRAEGGDEEAAADTGATAVDADENGCSCGSCAVSVTIAYCDGRTVEMRSDRGTGADSAMSSHEGLISDC